MTRSHHSPQTEACELPTIHIAGSDGVTFKRVPPKSFVQPRKMKTEVFKYSRSRKDSAVHVSLSSSSLVKQPGITWIPPFHFWKCSGEPHPTTNNNRLLSAVESLIVMRSLPGREKMRWPRGPMHRRAQWPGYRPARSELSTPIVNKLSHRSQVFWDAKKSLYFGPLAALEPHSCDVLTISHALNRRCQWGCRH